MARVVGLRSVTGGRNRYRGAVRTAQNSRDDIEFEWVARGVRAAGPRRHHGVSTGSGDIITRIGRLRVTFAERAADADIVHTHDWFGYGPGSRAKSNNEDVEWVTTFHSLSSDRNMTPPQREVETEQRVANRSASSSR